MLISPGPYILQVDLMKHYLLQKPVLNWMLIPFYHIAWLASLISV